ncbi:MAG: CDP-diacylglycerol--glycerol-3-phosphate 3-phosphatidyltransferase [Oscillospiraceae bacterium]|jgi:CDP-diacylglycerol--glycerol-3-phosphate 3-phosphatidyltransferase|nr:CDP-diacylglycerol--glycerol-3-phosphate 3-phosphatidyltransferase [Oscillospiraceae bacterium]
MTKLNTPNRLTLLRVVLTPLFLAAMLLPLSHRYLWAALLFCLASATDFLDGHLARQRNQITVFGQLLDPVADKILATAALLAFMQLGWCNIWAVMLVLTREFLITSVRLVAVSQGMVIPANRWGKAKTVSQMTFTALLLFLADLRNWVPALPMSDKAFTLLANVLMWLVAAMTLVSGLTYLSGARKVINFTKD